MIAILFAAAFSSVAVFAGWVIAVTVRRHLASFAKVRSALKASPGVRDVRYSIRTIEVRSLGARVYRPDFTARTATVPLRAAA